MSRLWVMVTGPDCAKAADAAAKARNLAELNRAALAVFERGHLPVIGVNLVRPIIEAAGQERYGEIMMPVSLALAERCYAVLRIGAPSDGADQEVARFQAQSLPVYRSLDEMPDS